MKLVVASLVAVLLGAAAGWHNWHGAKPVSDTGGETTVPAPATPPAEEAGKKRAEAALGKGWRTWAERIGAATATAELEILFGELIANEEDSRLRKTAGKLLGARWVELDPAAGVRFLDPIEKANWALHPLLTEWVLLDQEAALAGFAMLDARSINQARQSVFGRLGQRAPGAALDFMRVTRYYPHYYDANEWWKLALARPDELAELIVEIETANLERGERYQAYTAIRAVAGVLAKRDPRAALAWADDLFGSIRSDAVRTVMTRWAYDDPKTVLRQLAEWDETKTGPEGVTGTGYFIRNEMARALAREDLKAGADWVKDRWSAIDSFTEVASIRMGKGEVSLDEVFDVVAAVKSHNDTVPDRVFPELWNRMSSVELEEGFDLLLSKPESTARTLALSGLLREAKGRDPGKAVALLNQLPAGPARDAVAAKLLPTINLERQRNVADLLMQMLPEETRATVIAAQFAGDPEPPGKSIRDFSPHFYAETLASTQASQARTDAIERLALHWGGYDPAAAMEWASRLPPAEAIAATAAAARGWAPHDSYSLSLHLLEMPDGRHRDAATAELVDSVRESEPDSAWQWAAQIDDPATRSRSLRAVVESWMVASPEEARAAVENAELPAAEQRALRALLQP